jgi:outer membrane protein assembly factor BamE (lipoprotein component of BamABCDE complex)
MRKIHLTLTCLLFSAAALFMLSSCDKGGAPITNTRITAANVAKLSKGMDRTQVEALFGQPTKVGEVENDVIFKKQTDTWVEGKESLSVTYKNNEVETFNSTVGSTTTTTTDDGQTKTTTTSTTNSQ